MAVAVFGTIGTGSASSNTDPLDHNHTIASGSSEVLLVAGTQWRDSADTLSEVRWDPATDNELLTEDVEAVRGRGRAALSHFAGPANQDDTAYTLRHDFSGLVKPVVGGGINFSGVDQGTPTSNATSEVGGSGGLNVTVTTNADADDMVVDSVYKESNTTLTVDGSQVERWNISAGQEDGGFSTEGGGTNPTEMDWTFTGGTDDKFVSCGMLINAVAAGGGTLSPLHYHHRHHNLAG